ncbi:Protein CBG10514 [Caenorhabditis briggsae]|uniref:Protein CBG10514 n=1 Tax=Caenorhabditis briggsae TaxID=6238 RepID=A8XAZ5_CAEBR|nr:Protein CBG10514 [Caenorhabditis briggsae]CAP29923.1 Protein CBG10514 [Caenorhabditis briggsae]
MLSGKVVIEERRTKLNGPKDFDVANVDQLEGKSLKVSLIQPCSMPDNHTIV